MPGSSHEQQNATQRDQRAQKRDLLRETMASGKEELVTNDTTKPPAETSITSQTDSTDRIIASSMGDGTENRGPMHNERTSDDNAKIRTETDSIERLLLEFPEEDAVHGRLYDVHLRNQRSGSIERTSESLTERSEKRGPIHGDISSEITKKPRIQAVAVHHYNLRPNKKRITYAASVTPTSCAPLVTPTSGAPRSWLTRLRAIHSEDKTPVGVVRIYEPQIFRDIPTCTCPTWTSLEQDLAFQHMTHYGKECHSDLVTREDRYSISEIYDEQDSWWYPSDRTIDTIGSTSPPGTPKPGNAIACRPLTNEMVDLTSAENNCRLARQPYISVGMRSVLVNWLNEMGLEYGVSDTAFHLAVTLLDSILVLGPTRQEFEDHDWSTIPSYFIADPSEFQALGCACMWIAAKLEDKIHPKVDQLVYIGDESFDEDLLRHLELEVCKWLKFRLHRVTPIHYVDIFLRASHACRCSSCQYDPPVLRKMVLYLIELSRVTLELAYDPYGLTTGAAVFLARATLGIKETNVHHMVDKKGYWTKTLEHYTGFTLDDIKSLVYEIHKVQMKAETSRNNAAFKKYRTQQNYYVSLKTVLPWEEIGLKI